MSHKINQDQLVKSAYERLKEGQVRVADDMCRQILSIDPDNVQSITLQGLIFLQKREPQKAVERLLYSLSINSRLVQSHLYLGMAFNMLDRINEAIEQYGEVLDLMPSNLNARMNRAVALKQTGRLDEAAEDFQTAIQIKPDLALAHFHLASLRSRTPTEMEIDQMKKLYASQNLKTTQRIYLAFALGTALDKLGRYEEAYKYFANAHLFKNEDTDFNFEARLKFFDSIIDLFSNEFFEMKVEGGADETPIFIVGMPRSGTTLVEQILSSHPQVSGTGEHDYIEDIVRIVIERTGKPFIAGWRDLDSEHMTELGEQYMAKLHKHACITDFVIDKTPLNFIYIGLIISILPKARIVHCHRNPMDTCLSIYQHPFSDAHTYANDLEDLGNFYRLYKKLMAHWHQVLPGKIYDVCYEDLVTNSELQIHNLLEYLGLPYHEACLKFDETSRLVKTPSASQVRQPMHSRSIGRWKNYEKSLQPLKAILDGV